TDRRFNRRHRNVEGGLAEDILVGLSFCGVVVFSRVTVRIHIVNSRRAYVRCTTGRLDGDFQALGVNSPSATGKSALAGTSVASYLGINGSMPMLGVLELLEDNGSGGLGEHQSRTETVIGSGRRGGRA